jgi:2-methylcitrate dehydratase PrpD
LSAVAQEADPAAAGVAHGLAQVLLAVADGPLSERARTAAKQRLLHGLGVGLASTQLAPYTVSRRALSAESGACTVLASAETLGEGAAAFVNAVTLHSSLQEDCGPGGYRDGSHPGVYVIPAALAAAESAGASGEQLLRGIAVGYEAASRIGASVPSGMAARKFRPVGVVGPRAAAAAAASILARDADVIRRALGIAANLSAGTSQGFVPGTMEPYFHAGFAARNGLLAARLAAAGASSAPDALEGPYGFFAVYAGEPGYYRELTVPREKLAVEQVGSKKYAVCLQNQESLELAVELRQQIAGQAIRAVRLQRPNTPANGTASPGVGAEPPYATMLQRQMAARYTVAAALLGRDLTHSLYFHDRDEQAAVLAEKTELVTTADEGDLVLAAETGTGWVTISGRRPEILFPSPDETARLFLARARPVLGATLAVAGRQLIDSLSAGTSVGELTRLLRGGDESS